MPHSITNAADAPAQHRDEEFTAYSSFIGNLVLDGLMDKGSASVLLVQAFWENERAKAWDHGIDLDAIIAERKTHHARKTAQLTPSAI